MSRWIACCILALGTLATAPFALMAQQITSLEELKAAAGETWSLHRNHADLDLEMAIEEQTVVTGLPNQPDIDFTSSLVRFAHKNLLFLKSVSMDEAGNETEHILASNEQSTFHVSRTAGAAWRLNAHEFESAIESLADDQTEELSQLMRELERGLDDDFRYEIGDQHIADFLQDHEAWVRAIRVKQLDVGKTEGQRLDTIVVIELEGRIEGTDVSRQRAGVEHTLISGSIQLLPARHWSILDYALTYSGKDDTGAEVNQSHTMMQSHFSDDAEYAQRIERVTWNTRGFKNQSTRNYRPLTMDEVAAIQEQCRLEAYGLSEPRRGSK